MLLTHITRYIFRMYSNLFYIQRKPFLFSESIFFPQGISFEPFFSLPILQGMKRLRWSTPARSYDGNRWASLTVTGSVWSLSYLFHEDGTVIQSAGSRGSRARPCAWCVRKGPSVIAWGGHLSGSCRKWQGVKWALSVHLAFEKWIFEDMAGCFIIKSVAEVSFPSSSGPDVIIVWWTMPL